MAELWIEAESFTELGGWVVDQQSMNTMGSAYVMAHGMGVPVADARTCREIPASGTWHVWVRTRDWTAIWKRGTSGGRFELRINGSTLPQELGTNGSEWGWQKAGSLELSQGDVEFVLHDLTGFNGRCDALYLTTDADKVPPNDPRQLAAFRREVAGIELEEAAADYDLIVAGGGAAGVCTAISAIKSGLKVALIQDREILGGCNSSEIRVSMGGLVNIPPYPNLGNVVQAIAPAFGSGGTYAAEFYEDARKRNIFRMMPDHRYTLALNEQVVAVEKSPDDPTRITALITRHCLHGGEKRYSCSNFADCTGDAVIARLMGAELMYGREGKETFGEELAAPQDSKQVMGMSVIWFSRKDKQPTSFPDIDWGIEFNEGNAYYIRNGDWEWETGQYRNQALEAEYIRDYSMMALYANWSFLKNRSKRRDEWANDTLDWVSPIGGKRESYRVVGDVVLTQNDIEQQKEYPDATGAMSWSIDLHFPDPENEEKFAEPFRSCAYHRSVREIYPVPYRCLYARDVKNLFLGGRHISMSHVAFSSVRVMRTLGMLGEVIGMAASICAKKGISPREVYTDHFGELQELMEKGIHIHTYHAGRSLGPVDDFESYHFKELGHLHLAKLTETQSIDEELKRRIGVLGITHRNNRTIK